MTVSLPALLGADPQSQNKFLTLYLQLDGRYGDDKLMPPRGTVTMGGVLSHVYYNVNKKAFFKVAPDG